MSTKMDVDSNLNNGALDQSTVQSIKSLGRIAVLMGGNSMEREISLRSGQAVSDALTRQSIEHVLIDVRFDRDLFDQLANIDFAFIALHGPGGEDGKIQAILDIMGIAYTGSGVTASALAMDKFLTKKIWQAHELPTPGYQKVASLEQALEAFDALGAGSVMVKPLYEGSSIGVSLVKERAEMQKAFELAAKSSSAVLIEQFIVGKEYSCSIVDHKSLPIVQLIPAGEFYDYDAKYVNDNTQYKIPSGLTDKLEQSFQAICLEAYQVIGCEGWGRVDFMVQDDQIYLIEVNTSPGMTPQSLVPKSAASIQIDFDTLVMKVMQASKC